MSNARLCDGCGKVETERPYMGWWRLQEDDGDSNGWFTTWASGDDSGSSSSEDVKQKFHVCSWDCVAQLALAKADLFKEGAPPS
jgi:hypothetical protein